MRDLRPGHEYLKSGRFSEADKYFSAMAECFKDDPQTLNGCLYGQARAMVGLRNLPSAITLLTCVITNVPNWEAPYISLARVYELQGTDYRAQGMYTEAKRMFTKAEETYEAALIKTPRSERLTEHFEYFQREHGAQFAAPSQTKGFMPSFAAAKENMRVQAKSGVTQETTVQHKPLSTRMD